VEGSVRAAVPLAGRRSGTFRSRKDAVLAGGRSVGDKYTHSRIPLFAPRGTALVLPSPNGSTLALSAKGPPVYTACLRNAPTVAMWATVHGPPIAVIPAGERWHDSSRGGCSGQFCSESGHCHYRGLKCWGCRTGRRERRRDRGVSENCAETHQSRRLATAWKGHRPISINAGNVSGDAMPKTCPESRPLLYTTRSPEAKMEIPGH
jgi:hypothetical protein